MVQNGEAAVLGKAGLLPEPMRCYRNGGSGGAWEAGLLLQPMIRDGPKWPRNREGVVLGVAGL